MFRKLAKANLSCLFAFTYRWASAMITMSDGMFSVHLIGVQSFTWRNSQYFP